MHILITQEFSGVLSARCPLNPCRCNYNNWMGLGNAQMPNKFKLKIGKIDKTLTVCGTHSHCTWKTLDSHTLIMVRSEFVFVVWGWHRPFPLAITPVLAQNLSDRGQKRAGRQNIIRPDCMQRLINFIMLGWHLTCTLSRQLARGACS